MLTYITTERLLLRPLTAADVEGLVFLRDGAAGPDVAGWAAWLRAVRSLQRCEGEGWAVLHRGDPRTLIGMCVFGGFDPASGEVVITYGLEAHARRQGFGREALAAFIDYAFGWPHIVRIRADVDCRNRASLAVLEALHFSSAGRDAHTVTLTLGVSDWPRARPLAEYLHALQTA